MTRYFIVDLGKSHLYGRLVLHTSRKLQGGTCDLARALRLPEGEANTDLGRYDNGSTTQAILCELVEQLAHNGNTYAIPHRELTRLVREMNTEALEDIA